MDIPDNHAPDQQPVDPLSQTTDNENRSETNIQRLARHCYSYRHREGGRFVKATPGFLVGRYPGRPRKDPSLKADRISQRECSRSAKENAALLSQSEHRQIDTLAVLEPTAKRGRGRPRKEGTLKAEDSDTSKRELGRPGQDGAQKLIDPTIPKRGRGRPRKETTFRLDEATTSKDASSRTLQDSVTSESIEAHPFIPLTANEQSVLSFDGSLPCVEPGILGKETTLKPIVLSKPKRGRPPKHSWVERHATDGQDPAELATGFNPSKRLRTEPTDRPVRKRGRPRKSQNSVKEQLIIDNTTAKELIPEPIDTTVTDKERPKVLENSIEPKIDLNLSKETSPEAVVLIKPKRGRPRKNPDQVSITTNAVPSKNPNPKPVIVTNPKRGRSRTFQNSIIPNPIEIESQSTRPRTADEQSELSYDELLPFAEPGTPESIDQPTCVPS